MIFVRSIFENGRPFVIAENGGAAWVADPVFDKVIMSPSSRIERVLHERVLLAEAYNGTKTLEIGDDTAIYMRDSLVRKRIVSVAALTSVKAEPYALGVTVGCDTATVISLSGRNRWYAPWLPCSYSTEEAIDKIVERVSQAEPAPSAYRAILETNGILKALHLNMCLNYVVSKDQHRIGWGIYKHGIEIITGPYPSDLVVYRHINRDGITLTPVQAAEMAAASILTDLADEWDA